LTLKPGRVWTDCARCEGFAAPQSLVSAVTRLIVEPKNAGRIWRRSWTHRSGNAIRR